MAVDLLAAYSEPERLLVLVADHAFDFEARTNVRVVALSHRWFGRYLRPLFELAVNVALLLRIASRTINLSHYGWVLWGEHHIYIHSPEVVSETPARGLSDGRMNRLKEYFLNTTLRGARRLYVQTNHMEKSVAKLLRQRGLGTERLRLLRPQLNNALITKPEARAFEFQAFYPVSAWPHKRPDLAIQGMVAYNKENDPSLAVAGLVITVAPSPDLPRCVQAIGAIARKDVFAFMAASDFLLFTSEQETLGLPLIEALQTGLPAVLPRLGYAVELYGDAAEYYDEPSCGAIANAIWRLKGRYAERRGRVAPQLAKLVEQSTTWAEHWKCFLEP